MADTDHNPEHRGTYDAFMVMLKWSTIAAAVVTAFVIYLLVS